MSHVKVFPLKKKDYEKVLELAEKNLPGTLSEKTLADAMTYEYNHYFVAYDVEDDRILGFAGMMVSVDEAELLYIATDSSYRRKGVGGMLLSRVIRVAKEHKVSRLLLEVRENNQDARRFYEHNEFVFLTIRKDYYHNPKENAVIMERSIEV